MNRSLPLTLLLQPLKVGPTLDADLIAVLSIELTAEYEDLSLISASTFQLPDSFSKSLRKVSNQLYSGVGFQIVHGLDPTKYTQKQKLIVYAGISAHVVPQRGFIDVVAKGVVGKPVFDTQNIIRR